MKESYSRAIYGKSSDQGFFLPFSLFILFLFTLAVLQMAQLYESEKRFFQLVERERQLETLIHHSVKDVIGNEEIFPFGKNAGEFIYDVGKVLYKIELVTGYIQVQLEAILETGERMLVTVLIDPETGNIIDWYEI